MKRLTLHLIFSLIAVSLSVASSASATAFTVSGSNDPSAYTVFSSVYPDALPAIAANPPAGPWVGGSWMTYNNGSVLANGSGQRKPAGGIPVLFFNLAGLDPATAILSGSWASDNGSTLYLNNFDDVIGTTSGYSNLTNFTINSGFLPGENSLVFIVTNDPYGPEPGVNPTGLLVNIDQATANPVPEPSTLLLLGAGLIGVCLLRRRA